MRYLDWDVLVFPEACKVPSQEFQTSCAVFPDPEPHVKQTTQHYLPIVHSFIPGLPAGTGFRISIHSWRDPMGSKYIETLKRPGDTLTFEARVFIDGRLAGMKWFGADDIWPMVIELGVELDKNGDFEKLRFPPFHQELLHQGHHWTDEIGRVKVIVAEGFARENVPYPFERLKNIVSFSFQHAPLDILENNDIAWPNYMMWKRATLVSPFHGQQPPLIYQQKDILEAHGHSPRHQANSFQRPILPTPASFANPTPMMQPNVIQHQYFEAPAQNHTGAAFARWQGYSSDVSMPDYSSSSSTSVHPSSRNTSDPMYFSERGDGVLRPSNRGLPSVPMPGPLQALCEALIPARKSRIPSTPPANTPRAPAASPATAPVFRVSSTSSGPAQVSAKGVEDVGRPAKLLVKTPQDAIKSRKENNSDQENAPDFRLAEESLVVNYNERLFRITSQSGNNNQAGNGAQTEVNTQPRSDGRVPSSKRQRVVTPSSKFADDEDEPRSSPIARKVSRASVMDGKDHERRILGVIELANA